MNIEITNASRTEIVDGGIKLDVLDKAGRILSQEFANLKDEAIRKRLVELGWSPPWQPIETAPKDNKRLLHLAQMNEQGQVVAMDTNCIWEHWQESWELPHITGWYWSGDYAIDEPTHWRFMDESFPKPATEKEN